MFRAYFGDLSTGRLARLPFLGYLVLLSVLFVFYGLGIAFGIGVAEYLIRGDLPAAQVYLTEHVGLPVIILTGFFILILGFAKLNLIAKRIRDMGLPGWWTLLGIYLAFGLVSFVLPSTDLLFNESNQVRGIIAGIITFGLILIPSGLFIRIPPAFGKAASADPG